MFTILQPTSQSSDATIAAYGTFIGNRYKGFNNIVYVVGGDYNSAQTAVATKLSALANDVAGGGPKPHHNSRALPGRKWHARKPRYCGLVWRCRLRSELNIGLNWAYDTQSNVVAGCRRAAFTDSSGGRFPPLMGEDWYELEHGITGFQARQEGYWEVLWGVM